MHPAPWAGANAAGGPPGARDEGRVSRTVSKWGRCRFLLQPALPSVQNDCRTQPGRRRVFDPRLIRSAQGRRIGSTGRRRGQVSASCRKCRSTYAEPVADSSVREPRIRRHGANRDDRVVGERSCLPAGLDRAKQSSASTVPRSSTQPRDWISAAMLCANASGRERNGWCPAGNSTSRVPALTR